jgi:hypothetical protein
MIEGEDIADDEDQSSSTGIIKSNKNKKLISSN